MNYFKYYSPDIFMKGRCEECGLENVEVMKVSREEDRMKRLPCVINVDLLMVLMRINVPLGAVHYHELSPVDLIDD